MSSPAESLDIIDASEHRLRRMTGLTRVMPTQPVRPGPSSAASMVLAGKPGSFATAGTGGIARRWRG